MTAPDTPTAPAVGAAPPVEEPDTTASKEGPAMAEQAPPATAISVVICAYTEDRWNDLVEAVASVEAQSLAARETIVVIDHNPEMLERVRRELSGVVAVENSEQRGLSGARNGGIAVAKGEVIAFIDDDALANPDWLERLAEAYRDQRVIGVGGAVDALWLEGRPRAFPEEFDWIVGCTYRGLPEVTSPVRNPIGANMSFRADVFERVGTFTSGIGRVGTRPVGCEETEFGIRATRGRPEEIVLYEPRARVRHRVPGARGRFRYFRTRCYSEGLSKALVARCAGAGDALASEWTYTLRTLPLGVLRGLGRALRGDIGGLGRAAAIVAGLAITTVGYGVGVVRSRDFERTAPPAPLMGH